MLNNTLKFLLIIFSGLLAFGTIDPILPTGSPIGSTDIVFILFAILFILVKPKDFAKSLLSFNFFALLTMVILFSLAQSLYGYEILVKPLFNFKILLCILFFIFVSSTFSKDLTLIHYCLLVFTVSCFTYSILVLFISPNLYQIYKGQLIVLEENPNSTSSRLVLAAIYIIYTFIKNPLLISISKKFILLFMLPTLVTMIILSGSRGSLLALIVGLYLIFSFSKIAKVVKILLTICSLLISGLLFKFLMSSEDLSNRWQGALEGDTAGRTEIWSAVFEIVKKHPFGIGENGYVETIPNYIGQYLDTHNIFLYILVCGGWISLFIFLTFLIRILTNSLKVYYKSKDLLALIFFLIIIFIASKTGGAITYLMFWFVLAISNSYRIAKYEK